MGRCFSLPFLIISAVLLGGFGFGFYSFARSCQMEATKRNDQCNIDSVFMKEARCNKANFACWIVYTDIGFMNASPVLFQHGVYTSKIDAENAFSQLKNKTTTDCVIAPCFMTHDGDTCIYPPGAEFGTGIVLALLFGVLALGALAGAITLPSVGMCLSDWNIELCPRKNSEYSEDETNV